MDSKILVEVSARHVHLSVEDLYKLFGQDYQLTKKKDLSQPGEFACEERLKIIGPKGELNNVIILGPTRPSTQVEVSLTDARVLGINALVRESGDIVGTAGCFLCGPLGEINISEGVIVAKRHLHVTPQEAEGYGITNQQTVGIKITSEERSLIFYDVVVRIRDSFAAAVHIDTDEANAAGFSGGYGEIVK